MSAAVYLVIRCDADDPAETDGRCGAEGSWAGPAGTHTELRQVLRRESGWRRPRPGRDICPDCWTAGRR